MTQDSLQNTDSTFSYPEADTLPGNESISFFSEYSKQGDIRPQEVNSQSNDWMFGVIFLGYILFILVHVFNRKRLNNIIRAFFAKRLVNQMAREGNIISEGMFIALFLIFVSCFSLLIYLIIGKYYDTENIGYWGFTFYLQIFIGVLLFLFLKFLMIKVSEKIFKTRELSAAYIFNYNIFIFFEGLMLLPLLTLIIYLSGDYSSKILIGSVFLILSIIVFRLFRGIIIGLSSKNFQLFQLFLYFCTHEIIPILLIAKLVKDYLV